MQTSARGLPVPGSRVVKVSVPLPASDCPRITKRTGEGSRSRATVSAAVSNLDLDGVIPFDHRACYDFCQAVYCVITLSSIFRSVPGFRAQRLHGDRTVLDKSSARL